VYALSMGKGAQGRGSIFFDHEGAACTDSRYHRHCQGRWRGQISKGFGPDGRRRRYKVSGRTKQDVIDALKKKGDELNSGLSTSQTYSVQKAADDWLERGLPGRSDRTRQIYRDALAPLLENIGKRALRDLGADEIEAALKSLTEDLSSRSLKIAHESLRRAIRYAQAKGKVGRNVAALIDTPKGRAGRQRRAFALGQTAALIAASRTLPELELHPGLKDPRRPASLMHAYITVSLMSGIRPEEARAIGWKHDVNLDSEPPSVAVLRADRAGGDVKTPKSRRALQLPQLAVAALREWQEDQAAERQAAGAHWRDTGRVFTTATGAPLDIRNIRRMFKAVCVEAGLGRDWAPRDLRRTFVSLLSDDGMAIEKISRLVGHTSSHVTETVYRQELRPVLQEGAEVMDRLFGSVKSASVSAPRGCDRRAPSHSISTSGGHGC
jgi:integrase